MKAPSEGDKVIHREPIMDRETTGTVTHVLSAQFVYQPEDGPVKMCLFNEDWDFTGASGEAPKRHTRAKRGRMDVYNAWVAYRKEHLGGCKNIKAIVDGEELSWTDGIYHPSCPSSLTLRLTRDGEQLEERHEV